ncbi:MAG TPA: hydroxymethylglutaryl-CoA reductase, degradative [Kofleriaceae bacterium]|nr:hydroxymethylglutaryl-CoA reductase, degradative [Kofleriaceae bacterium]
MTVEGGSRIPGLYRLGIPQRRERVAAATGLDACALAILDRGGLELEIADGMIENVIGTYALPLGVATNFLVDGKDYLVPMVLEEPSVVAAASNAAKMVRAGGGFEIEASEPVMIAQIQITDVPDPEAAALAIEDARAALLATARATATRMVARGGGPLGLEVRILSRPDDVDGGMLVVHLLIDCRDAMGANLVNSMAEAIADDLAAIAGGAVGLRILSNLSDERMVCARCCVPDAALAGDAATGASVRRAIVAASRFAELDPYRAATHNKGIMNGVDAVMIATGNDWRGVEAGAHAYACRGGAYRPLAIWRSNDDDDALLGTLELPLAAGIVGGALHVHPGARLALELLAVSSAVELAGVAAAVGLASNLAALRALATDGIQRGHMSLHARVVARAAGATGDLIERVARQLAALGDVKTDRAKEILDRLRAADHLPTDGNGPPKETT